jgi:RNA polymerase sigma-70 factor (ECF subfamily)
VATNRREELALVQSCVAGDRAAWDAFVERYRPGVVAVARRALLQANADDPWQLAEDVASEVFCQLLARDCRTLASFEGRSGLGTWLGVLARRRAGRLLSKRPRSGRLNPQRVDPDQRTPSHEARIHERKRQVRDGLAELPKRDRLALQLYYEGQRSYREVAEILGMPPAHVSSLLARAKARLAKSLERSRRLAAVRAS